MSPANVNGKICYLEIPTTDVARSAAFYATVFGWQSRKRGDGALAFDDTTGQVSGSWVTGRTPAAEPTMLIYIMVDSVAKSCEAIVANGGEIVRPMNPEEREIIAWFRDPGSNVLGLYQEPSLGGGQSA